MMIRKNIMQAFCAISVIMLLITILQACTKSETRPDVLTDSIYDIDSNVYPIVKIGNQWWMAKNLEVKHFRNGRSIKEVPLNSQNIQWDTNLNQAACCLYQGNTDAPGLLYNWYAVTDTNNIAPLGWHVATDADWQELEQFLGMSISQTQSIGWRGSNEGNKLKIEGPLGWTLSENPSRVWGNNQSGFAALAGSCRLFNGQWGSPGLNATGFWWTASANDSNTAWYRYLDYNKSEVFRYFTSKAYGFSIRCVKDK